MSNHNPRNPDKAMFDYPPTKYRDTQNRRLLRGLFMEFDTTCPTAIYTLKDTDQVRHDKSFPSLYRLYLEAADLTEYSFANTHLENWEHWTLLCDTLWFQPYITRWRTELELKLKSEALMALIEESKDGGKNSYNALRFIIEKGWIDKSTEPSRRGRPSKADIARAAAEEVFSSRQVDEDFKRLELSPSTKDIN